VTEDVSDTLLKQSYLIVFASGLSLLCILGYLLVEIWPVRAIVTLQAFRYLYIPVWFGVIFTAIALARVLRHGSFAKRCVYSLLLIGASNVVQPLALLIGAAAYAYWARLPDRRLTMAEAALAALLLYPILTGLHGYSADMPRILLSLSVAFVAVFVSTVPQPAVRLATLGTIIVTITLGAVFAGDKMESAATKIGERFKLYSFPTLDLVASHADQLSETLAGLVELATYSKSTLPKDAVVLAPPNFGAFRIFAERAIVVDFKSWTFGHPKAWYDRMNAVYGALDAPGGFPLMERLDDRYREINDAAISRIADDYAASHAILHRATLTDYPVLMTTMDYKLIEITP
jgi:hypothetical protein